MPGALQKLQPSDGRDDLRLMAKVLPSLVPAFALEQSPLRTSLGPEAPRPGKEDTKKTPEQRSLLPQPDWKSPRERERFKFPLTR